jgi:iron complex outermembrane receptor protein
VAIRANVACRFLQYLRSRSPFSTSWQHRSPGTTARPRTHLRLRRELWIGNLDEAWSIGGTATYIQGEYEDDNRYIALDSSRIPPLKLTAYVQNETLPGWNNRLQFLYSGNRDRAFKDGSDGGPISSYLTVDYISAVKIGSGLLQVKVENLLNNQYFPVISQYSAGFGSDSVNYAGRGLTLSVNYRLNW